MTDNTSTTSSCCCGSTSEQTTNPAATADSDNLLASPKADATTCPVMVGTPVDKKVAEAAGLYRDYNGERYWFCCASCGPAFDFNPAKYAANMA